MMAKQKSDKQPEKKQSPNLLKKKSCLVKQKTKQINYHTHNQKKKEVCLPIFAPNFSIHPISPPNKHTHKVKIINKINDYLNKIKCIINNMMWVFYKSSCIK